MKKGVQHAGICAAIAAMSPRMWVQLFLLSCAYGALVPSSLAVPGDVDLSFNPSPSNSVTTVLSTVLQPDGKIIVGGSFTNIAGAARTNLARLNLDGTLDAGFNPNPRGGGVGCIFLQDNGKILIGGSITNVAGVARTNLVRLNADGSLDSSFAMNANNSVYCMAAQADGKIIVGGAFTNLGGQARSRLARLNADGSLDGNFAPSANNLVYCVAVQTDWKIVVGGVFTNMAGATRNRLARLNVDGTLDADFNPDASSTVYSIAMQSDDKILAGGSFFSIGGASRTLLARINPDGTVDSTFNSFFSSTPIFTVPGPGSIYGMALQSDGKILCSGNFSRIITFSSITRNGLARLNSLSGAVDTTFDPPGGADNIVYDVTLQPDGNILVGGSFSTIGGVARRRIARLQNDLAGQRLSVPSADRVEWRLSGSFPETKLVIFDLSTDGGTNWSSLGAGIRMADTTWALTNLSLPTTGLVRARTRIVGGAYNGSSGLTEAIVALPPNVPPAILNPIADFTVNEDSPDTVIDVRPVFQDTETPASNLVFTVQYNSNPSLISPAIDATNGTLILHCLTNQSGTATVVVRATDAMGGFEEDTFVVMVRQLHDGDPGDLAPIVYPDSNSSVYALATQPDGKTVIGGSFTALGTHPRTGIARFHANGLLDASFAPVVDGSIYCCVVQEDGKIIIGGSFTNVNGEQRNRLARLNSDGSLDAGYTLNLDSNVWCMALQPDGKIVIGGDFTDASGQIRNRIARLNADGTLDTGYDPNAADGVYAAAVQTDGRIVVGGNFTNIGGLKRIFVARLNTDGTGDASFTVNTNSGGGCRSLFIQPDGKIIIGASFIYAGGIVRRSIARINTDCTIDESFTPVLGGAGTIYSMALQADGRLFLGGSFSAVNGVVRTNLARLNPDGTLDATFDAKLNSTVYGITLQNDGSLMVGGNFTSVGGVAQRRIVRLANDPNPQTLTATSAERVEWRLGAASPVMQATTFEQSTDRGATWNAIGQGIAFSNGWELAGLALPVNCLIRAKGRVLGGYANASHGFASMVAAFPSNAAPVVVNPIADLTVNEDSPDTVIDLRAVFQDAETPSSAMEYSVQASDNPILVSAFVNNTNGTLTLHCQTNQHGTATIAIRATDAAGLYVETLFQVIVNTVHDGDPGDVDLTFNPSANSTVNALAVQPGEKFLLAGSFTNVAGVARSRIARFNNDATLDPAFNPPTINSTVSGTILQADGKTVIGGFFTNVNGATRTFIARLNVDGTLDTGFDLALAGNPSIQTPAVYGMAMQLDGKILIGGHFTNIDGATLYNLVRLNEDGTLDTNFNAGTISRDTSFANVNCVEIQTDGRILIGGAFTNIAGTLRSRIARLNADGSLDTAFDPNASSDMNCIVEQPDGRILVGGLFTSIGGSSIRYLARLDSDGALDTSFNPYVNSNVNSVVLQSDGRIIIGGAFTAVGGMARNRLARLNPDGTLDLGFNPDVGGPVNGATLLVDGKVAIGGTFTNVGDLNWNRMARLFNEPASQSLNVASINRLVWSRSGSSPEAKFVTFDHSTDGGTNWTFLGHGSRISGGWELAGLNLPAGGLVRACARVVGGYRNSSSGLTEATATVVFTSPGITLQPQSQTSTSGGAATFIVEATGTPPLAYQWFFGSNALAGATNATLALTSVARSHSGHYAVAVTNAFGSVTSSNALLSVGGTAQRLLPLTALGGGRYRISFSDFGGGPLFDWDLSNLDVEGATDLNAANWVTLTNALVITNGVGQVEFVVTNSPPQQFYRIRMR
ncbi:MAG: immunoglobulin domain-containing protein [Verrucomicrobia bacterium]|nr:immunoglobulin domain-containing protein [Verrucomicrobiota bacterium]